MALRVLGSRTLIAAALAGVLLIDIWTPPENVSVCFIYALIVLLAFFHPRGASRKIAIAGTVLSIAGGFFQARGAIPWIPEFSPAPLQANFIGNRLAAIAVIWLTALLVDTRLMLETALRRMVLRERALHDERRRLLAVLSHETKTPLTIIDGQAYRLVKLSCTDRLNTIETAERAEKIRAAAKRISALIEGIAHQVAWEHGEIKGRPVRADLTELVSAQCRQFAEAHPNYEYVLEAGPTPIFATADPHQISAVIENLLSNATKFSSPGSRVSTSLTETQDKITLLVCDQGTGMAPEDRERLGKPYFRGRNADGKAGLGVGFYFLNRVVLDHGGSVDVNSDPGAGTTVAVTLPRNAAPEHRSFGAAGDRSPESS